jgi:hypothetical protein
LPVRILKKLVRATLIAHLAFAVITTMVSMINSKTDAVQIRPRHCPLISKCQSAGKIRLAAASGSTFPADDREDL